MFLLLSFAGAVLDEKGGTGGLSSRLGMGSPIHQAEEPDKVRWDDMVRYRGYKLRDVSMSDHHPDVENYYNYVCIGHANLQS